MVDVSDLTCAFLSIWRHSSVTARKSRSERENFIGLNFFTCFIYMTLPLGTSSTIVTTIIC